MHVKFKKLKNFESKAKKGKSISKHFEECPLFGEGII